MMDPPRPRDLAHDLRNLLGLVRSVSQDLVARLEDAAPDVSLVSAELDSYTKFAMDALRTVERWEHSGSTEVSLGAWAWALRFNYRELRTGELWHSASVALPLHEALAGGAEMLRALGAGRLVDVDGEGAAIVFRVSGRAADANALGAALVTLRTTGLEIELVSQHPCCVRVAARPAR